MQGEKQGEFEFRLVEVQQWRKGQVVEEHWDVGVAAKDAFEHDYDKRVEDGGPARSDSSPKRPEGTPGPWER